ncbi:hypothetical protein [Candidatus Terasakiella magnetica]|nr:hypothetical protein [Candidatus Terasakiella magnetica]
MPTFDATTNTSVVKQTVETRKILKSSKETTEKVTGILDQAEDLNKAIGDGATVGVDAFKWVNRASNAANNALKACGIEGMIPPISGIEIPGIDLPEFDLSCMKSAFEAVDEVLFTYKKVKKGTKLTIESGSGEEAAAYKRPHYYPIGKEEALERQKSYRIKTIKTALGAGNRINGSSLSVNQTKTELATMGNSPADLNSLVRILISVELARYEQDLERNNILASYVNMEAAQLMDQVPVEEATGDD